MSIARAASLALRLGAIALVAASPWLAAVPRASSARSVIYVVDRSTSVGQAGLDLANDYLGRVWGQWPSARLGVVAFDGQAELLSAVGERKTPEVTPGSEPWASDLAAGIRLARAALPREGHRSIVLLTDARPTRGDAPAEIRQAAEAGIQVDVVPIQGAEPALPTILSVRPRSTHVAEKQPIAIDVDVRADRAFVVNWTRDGVAMPPKRAYFRFESEPGEHKVTLEDPNPPAGIHVYEVTSGTPYYGKHFGADGKELPRAAHLTAVSVEGKAQAIVFAPTNEVPPVLAAALAESGLDARALPIDRASDPASFGGADLVVLADARVSSADSDDSGLSRAGQTTLIDYVQQGGGLVVTGGVFGLAPEYSGTPMARALPVEIEDRGHVEDPPVALAIMLDRSGSMGAQVGSHTKIELAIEASLAAADVLRPNDQVALASVDTETHWNIPLGTVDRVAGLRADVRSVTAGGGGILVYTALRDAYAALDTAKLPVRHVILFSDTSDSEEQTNECSGCKDAGRTAESLAREARSKGITTTVVGIGEADASDTPFLRRLAAAAGGRFYLTSEGADLRRIFLAETRVLAQSNLREQKTRVVASGAHEILSGVDAEKLPELAAFVETSRRTGADTPLLISPEGRPMIASWRYGLGKVTVITTDLHEGWGTDWAASPVAQQLLRQTTRYTLRQNDARRADARVSVRGSLVEVDVELPADAPESAAPRTLEVFALEKSGASKKVPMRLEQQGAGRWVARGRSHGEPILVARARDGRGSLMAEAVGQEDRNAEIFGAGVDVAGAADLARLGDGRYDPSPTESYRLTSRPARELVAIWPYALLAAAGLVVLDLVVRRLGGRRRSTALRPSAVSPLPSAAKPAGV